MFLRVIGWQWLLSLSLYPMNITIRGLEPGWVISWWTCENSVSPAWDTEIKLKLKHLLCCSSQALSLPGFFPGLDWVPSSWPFFPHSLGGFHLLLIGLQPSLFYAISLFPPMSPKCWCPQQVVVVGRQGVGNLRSWEDAGYHKLHWHSSWHCRILSSWQVALCICKTTLGILGFCKLHLATFCLQSGKVWFAVTWPLVNLCRGMMGKFHKASLCHPFQKKARLVNWGRMGQLTPTNLLWSTRLGQLTVRQLAQG